MRLVIYRFNHLVSEFDKTGNHIPSGRYIINQLNDKLEIISDITLWNPPVNFIKNEFDIYENKKDHFEKIFGKREE